MSIHDKKAEAKGMGNANIDLMKILEASNLTAQEWRDLATILRRSGSGELTKKDMEDFVAKNDAPTRAEAFSNLARFPGSGIQGVARKGGAE